MSNLSEADKNYKKMLFIMNALDDGWTVRKRDDQYHFIKKHENRREVFQEQYLENFLLQMATRVPE